MSFQWLKQRVEKLKGLLTSPALVVLVLAAAACSAEPTCTPVPTPVPTETAVPEPRATPSEERVAEPDEQAMAFADYWNPPTEYYGQPVYGGTLRINYEYPLGTRQYLGCGFR